MKVKKVFSAYAEVFPAKNMLAAKMKGFLRVRGGVSTTKKHLGSLAPFSPRTRRCFWVKFKDNCKVEVFSAYAEVFLYIHHPYT